MDKNKVIGFALLGVLFVLYFWYAGKQSQAAMEFKKHQEDSIARVQATLVKPVDTAAARADSLRRDSSAKASAAGDFTTAAQGAEQLTVVENGLMKVAFTNKGGQPLYVELKRYLSGGNPVRLGGSDAEKLGYRINTGRNSSASTSTLFFAASPVVVNADGSQTVRFTLGAGNGQSIVHEFVVRKDSYLMDWNLTLNGADQLLSQHTLSLDWDYTARQQQSSNVYERQQSRVCFMQDGDYDFKYATNGKQQDFDKPVNWLSMKQQFFNTTVLAKNRFQSGSVQLSQPADTSSLLFSGVASMKVNVPASAQATVPLQLYFGPNDYKVLQGYNNGMENVVDLGSGIFSFVKYINRWIIMPVFNFFASFISNFGWVILLLTLFIRLITSPLTYSSFLSGAKMKVLRPELDELKKKLGDDQQAFAMEQMKVFREAGVNPLAGCIPAVLQIPIFFALYSFFSSNISLRGQPFLWSHDLSSYDVIARLPFNVPFGFGDHVSLFTITAVITSFLISIYNQSMTPDQNNPALKYMPYIFPFVLLFIFNRLPSALTWYYTVSNAITLGLQFVIQHYIIDHEKILARMQENRKKPKVKSKWQERYGQMVEQQKKLQDLKDKGKR